jgi:two-component system sensor histidine kinase HydH
VITAIALGLGWLMSSIFTERMLQREGEVSMAFVRNLLSADQADQFFLQPHDEGFKKRFLSSMAHLSAMGESVRLNAYQTNGTVLWSTDPSLIGKHFPDNDELDEAISGTLVVHGQNMGAGLFTKTEHNGLSPEVNFYVESYIPILNPTDHTVLGVMELYKAPTQLKIAIRDAVIQLWLACALSALALFVTLYWTVARADRILHDQQAQLAESQTLATAVDLARAVAHNLRNPLASIRVSAEMLSSTDNSPQEHAEHCCDITASVDRADRWITELVRVSQVTQITSEVVQPSAVIRACLQEMTPEMNRRGIRWTMAPGEAPGIQAHTAMLRQILISILANSTDAMPDGGDIAVQWRIDGQYLKLQVIDNGVGIQDDIRNALFRPFFSTKSGGLGIGLALVKRMVEQWGGQVALNRGPMGGTSVELTLPLAAAAPTSQA